MNGFAGPALVRVAEGRQLQSVCSSALALRAGPEAPGPVSSLDNLAMMGEPIGQREGQNLCWPQKRKKTARAREDAAMIADFAGEFLLFHVNSARLSDAHH